MRIEQLTFTRFLAAFAIVMFHFGKLTFANGYTDFLLNQANVGVSYFFILSGFIMIISYGKYDFVNSFDYYKNRFARIYPIYLLGLLLFLPIRISQHPIAFDFLFHLTALQSWLPGWVITYNFPGWSVSVEVLFYLVFPFLCNYIYKNKKNFKVIAASIILFWIGSQVLFIKLLNSPFNTGYPSQHFEFIVYFPLLHLNEFLIGNLAGLYFVRNYEKMRKNYDWAVLLVVCAMIFALKFPVGTNYHNGLLGFIFIPLILLMSFNTGMITKLFKLKPLVFLGEVSYGLYIYQLPIFYYFKDLPIESLVLAFFVKAAILVIFSALSYVFIEKPLREKIRKLNLRPFWKTEAINKL